MSLGCIDQRTIRILILSCWQYWDFATNTKPSIYGAHPYPQEWKPTASVHQPDDGHDSLGDDSLCTEPDALHGDGEDAKISQKLFDGEEFQFELNQIIGSMENNIPDLEIRLPPVVAEPQQLAPVSSPKKPEPQPSKPLPTPCRAPSPSPEKKLSNGLRRSAQAHEDGVQKDMH